MRRGRLLLACALSGMLLALSGVAAESSWQARVPSAAAARQNPFAGSPQATAAGRKLFLDRCARCHGDDAAGMGKRPTLHSARVLTARDGELEWFLNNGDPAKGMPSWSKLPDQQRWQIVVYLKSLEPRPAAETDR